MQIKYYRTHCAAVLQKIEQMKNENLYQIRFVINRYLILKDLDILSLY